MASDRKKGKKKRKRRRKNYPKRKASLGAVSLVTFELLLFVVCRFNFFLLWAPTQEADVVVVVVGAEI